LKLYIFKKWHPGVQNIELEEWDTDEGIFKKEIAKAKNGGVVLDVGSEYGFYPIMSGRLVGSNGKVLAIEAHPETYLLLKKNIRLHGLTNCVIPICEAAGKNIGKLKLYETTSPGSTSVTPRQNPFRLNKSRLRMWMEFLRSGNILKIIQKRFAPAKYIVPVNTLDRIAEKYHLRRIDLIKIDVEGAELDVLKGSIHIIMEYKPILLVEVHYGFKWKPEAIYKMLREFGYNLTIEKRQLKSLVIARQFKR